MELERASLQLINETELQIPVSASLQFHYQLIIQV